MDFSPQQRGENHLTLSKMGNPEYEEYRNLHNKVGEPYGWGDRPRVNDRAKITKLLADNKVELWQFYNDSLLVGYALFSCAEDGSAELEDFGFFPEYCNSGFGSFFLSAILQRIAELGVKKVWLTTRSTNHSKVVPFYERMGFKIKSHIPIPDDT